LGFAAIGAAVGLLIGLVQDLFKQAWVRVLVGKNEGKEYLISNSVTTIGRSELCDIPLFGDPAIAPNHAAIEVDEAGGYILRVVAKMEPGVASVIVNGQVVSSAMGLANGDTIQLSKKQVEFHERMSRVRPADLQMSGTPVRSAPVDAIPAGSAVPHERDLGGRRLIWLDRNQPFILGSNGKFTIGRSLDRDIAIADSSVSRLHATIVAHAGVHSVSDEGSANGTSINGMPLPPRQSRELLPGDILGVGNAMLRYE
jgi:pSer/pThr/pTyr-binding forkhead associated (FHA) protein